MDVLELPRPVINFLRTMAKEGCRYVLSWDIFGGTDAVTLTLTWKSNDDQSQLLISKSPQKQQQQQQVHDELHIRYNDSVSSPRRSRRDENTSTSSMFRSPRGKSLEENHFKSIKQIPSHQPQGSSLERSSIINRQKKESNPIYANLCNVRFATNPLPSSSPLNNNPPLAFAHTHHRQTKQQCETPTLRKVTPLTSIISDTSSKLRRKSSIATRNDDDDDDDDDDTLDPWVKRFECSLEANTNEAVQKFEDNIDKIGITSGKVKFKRKPDYF